MNKYKEALDYIVCATNGGDGLAHQINVLKELIEEYAKLEKALDKACEQLKIAYPYGYNKFNICGLCGAKEEWKEHFLKEE